MDKRKYGSKLYLLGLGIFPPYTASMEALCALSECDVAFNNVAGPEMRQLVSQFCGEVRPAAYQAAGDERKWADPMFRELAAGRRVAFVTRGHPLVFGALARELIRRCRRDGVDHETFGAVSSIDHILAAMGRGLGEEFAGVQAFDRPAIESAKALNTAQPLIACFYDGLDGEAVGRFSKALRRFYPAAHECRMFGPKYDAPPRPVTIGALAEAFPSIHASLMLYVPGL